DFGMVASAVRGPRPNGLPQYIGVQRNPFMTRPTYLGVSHQAFNTGDPSRPGFAPQNLTLATGVDNRPLDHRQELVAQFDRFRRDVDLLNSLDGVDKFRASAFQLLASRQVADAFDINKEDTKVRDRYGRYRWGQSCLLARRLVEAGTSV